MSDEDALFLEVVLERLRPDAVEPGQIGEVILADGEQLRDGVVAQLAQEGQVGLERPALLGLQPVEKVQADAQRSAVAGERALELGLVLDVEDRHGRLAVDGGELVEPLEAEAALAALVGAESGDHERIPRALAHLLEAQTAVLTQPAELLAHQFGVALVLCLRCLSSICEKCSSLAVRNLQKQYARATRMFRVWREKSF